jgi:DNA-binding XRE family transcriptional regulator
MITEQHIRNAIACALITYRNEHSLTQKQMAKLLSLKKCTYASYEEHRRTPSLITAVIILQTLNISMYQLIKVDYLK